MRRQQPLSALDPDPIQPVGMSQSPCGKKEMGQGGVGMRKISFILKTELWYPDPGNVQTDFWPQPRKPIRDDLIGDSCPRKFLTRAQLPGPRDLSAALHMTRWWHWLSQHSQHGLIHSSTEQHSVPGSVRYWDYSCDQQKHSSCLQGIHTLGEDWDWKRTHHILIMVELWPYPRQ